MVVLEVLDHTNLGGPMGTETVRVITTSVYDTEVAAIAAACIDHHTRKGQVDGNQIRWYRHSTDRLGADCGSHGYRIFSDRRIFPKG